MRCFILHPNESFINAIEKLDESLYVNMVGVDFLEEPKPISVGVEEPEEEEEDEEDEE